jgi:thiamine phosphate synthase YjbQ (UPF0047 family)
MKSLRKELWFNASTHVAFINITKDVRVAVKESGVKEGFCLVNAMHITASVFINDDELGLHQDYQDWLEELAPTNPFPITATIAPVRTTAMHTSNARSWDGR